MTQLLQNGRLAFEESGEMSCLVCAQVHRPPERVHGREEEMAALRGIQKFVKAHGENCKMTKAVC